jgi:hypothetical protein
MTDAVLTPEQVEAVRDAILYGHDPRQPTVAEYVAIFVSHEALRRANAALNRRTQSAESGLVAALKGHERDGPSFGRALANAAATMYREQAEGLRAALAEAATKAAYWDTLLSLVESEGDPTGTWLIMSPFIGTDDSGHGWTFAGPVTGHPRDAGFQGATLGEAVSRYARFIAARQQGEAGDKP